MDHWIKQNMSAGSRMNQEKTIVIDEKTPLLILAGPMFLELLLNTMLNNVDTLMLRRASTFLIIFIRRRCFPLSIRWVMIR